MTCVTATNVGCPQWTYNANNQFTNLGFYYDAAGNLTQDGTGVGTHSYQWDGEGRLKSVDSGNSQTYVYNALGQRVQEVYPGNNAWDYLFDQSGRWLGASKAGTFSHQAIPSLGRQLAAYLSIPGAETYFIHSNNLDSTSMTTDHAGNVTEDMLFYPWGQLWTSTGTLWEIHYGSIDFFDGGTGTNNAGLNQTLFRSQSGALGRWMSPDPLAGDVTNPQSLNRYAYALNNPCSLVDPSGLAPPCSFNIGVSAALSDSQLKALEAAFKKVFQGSGVGINFNFSGPADFNLIVTGAPLGNQVGQAPVLTSGEYGGTQYNSNGVFNYGFVNPGLYMTATARYSGNALATVLGRAGAHEAGHYLLQQVGHADSGIMVPTPNVLVPNLHFTGLEAKQLQSNCNNKTQSPGATGTGGGGGGRGRWDWRRRDVWRGGRPIRVVRIDSWRRWRRRRNSHGDDNSLRGGSDWRRTGTLHRSASTMILLL